MNNLTNQTYQNQLQYMKQNVIIMCIIIFLLLIFTCWFYYLYKKSHDDMVKMILIGQSIFTGVLIVLFIIQIILLSIFSST